MTQVLEPPAAPPTGQQPGNAPPPGTSSSRPRPPHSIEMCWRFVEHLALRHHQATDPDGAPPVIDWDQVFAAGEGAPSLERAVGRTVVAASQGVPLVAPVEPKAEARAQRRETTRRHLPTVFAWVRNIGAIILLFVAWQLWGTAISEHHAQSGLAAQFEAKVHHAHLTKKGQSILIPAGVKVPLPPEGSVLAHLAVPAVGISAYVVSGTDTDDLSLGPGHYDGTAVPGQAGNVAIAGHRTTHGAPFNKLGQVVPGDTIELETLSGQHLVYRVTTPPFAVSPGDVAVLNNFGDNRITLTTCNPEFSAAQRLIVVGYLVLPHGAPKAVNHGGQYQIENANTASWRWGLLPIVLVEVAVLVLLGLFNRRLSRQFGRTGRWIILVPIWVAGFYALFQTLVTFLPPTL